jgi:membrane-associated phospholipid phosphatase
MISTDVLMGASFGAAAVVLIFLLNLFRRRKQLMRIGDLRTIAVTP